MDPSALLEQYPFLTDGTYWAGFGSALGVVIVLRLIWRAVGRLGRKPEPDLTPPPVKANAPPPELADNWEVGAPPPAPHERRHQLRRAGNPTSILLHGIDTHIHQGLVLDRSRGGLRILVPKAVEVGTTLRVRAPHAPDPKAWVETKIVWCASADGKYQAGCEFVATPPWNVLLLFG